MGGTTILVVYFVIARMIFGEYIDKLQMLESLAISSEIHFR